MAGKNTKGKQSCDVQSLPKDVVQYISKIAVAAGISAYEERHEVHVEDEKRRTLHDTKLILQNYRTLDEYNKNAIYDVAQICESGRDRLLEIMGVESGHKVESIENSVITTRLIMEHVDAMLEVYRIRCERSKREEERRRWNVIWKMYIGPDRMSPEEVAESENIGRSTVYNDIDAACKDMSPLFYGIYYILRLFR